MEHELAIAKELLPDLYRSLSAKVKAGDISRSVPQMWYVWLAVKDATLTLCPEVLHMDEKGSGDEGHD